MKKMNSELWFYRFVEPFPWLVRVFSPVADLYKLFLLGLIFFILLEFDKSYALLLRFFQDNNPLLVQCLLDGTRHHPIVHIFQWFRWNVLYCFVIYVPLIFMFNTVAIAFLILLRLTFTLSVYFFYDENEQLEDQAQS